MSHIRWHEHTQPNIAIGSVSTSHQKSKLWNKTSQLRNIDLRLTSSTLQNSMRQTPSWLSQFLLSIKVITDIVSWKLGVRRSRHDSTPDNNELVKHLLLQFDEHIKHDTAALLGELPLNTSISSLSNNLFSFLTSSTENREFLIHIFRAVDTRTTSHITHKLTTLLTQSGIQITPDIKSGLDTLNIRFTQTQKRLAFFQKLTPHTQMQLLETIGNGGYTYFRKRCVQEIQNSLQLFNHTTATYLHSLNFPLKTSNVFNPKTAQHILLALDWSKLLAQPLPLEAQIPRSPLFNTNKAVDTLWRLAAKLIEASGMTDSTSALQKVVIETLPTILNTLQDLTRDIKTKQDLEIRVTDLLNRALIPPLHREYLLTHVKKITHQVAPTILENLARSLHAGNHHHAGALLEFIPVHVWKKIASTIDNSIATLNPYTTFSFYKEFADKLCSGLGDNPVVQDVAKLITKGYYAALEQAEKRRLVCVILSKGGPEFEPNGALSDNGFAQLVLRMVQAGGPCFQKSMQLFKDDIPSKSLQNILEQVTNGITPLSKIEAEGIIQDNFQTIQFRDHKTYQLSDPSSYQQLFNDWPSRESMAANHLKCLGSATIGQTHLAYIQEMINGSLTRPKQVAIKIQRPGVQAKIQQEMAAMKRIDGINESLQDTFSALESGVLAEVDFNREAALADYLKPIYSAFSSKQCTTSVVNILASTKTMLVEDFSPGQPIPALIAYLKDTASQQDYSDFLHNAGVSLSQLVSGFCKASILGDQKSAYELHIGKPSELLILQKNNGAQFEKIYCIFKEGNQWFGQDLKSFQQEKSATNITQGINNRLGGKLAFHNPATPQSVLKVLDTESYSMLCEDLRKTLNTPLLFSGEAFVDSDRHAGNMLYERNPKSTDHLTIIDTGAGCIVTKQERKGMFKMVTGIASTNSQLFFDGLTALIPTIVRKNSELKKALYEDVTRVITGQNIVNEKLNFIYQHLLKSGYLHGDETASIFFKGLDTLKNTALKKAILDFDNYEAHKQALITYLMQTAHADAVVNVDFESYESKIQNANFERFIAVNPFRSLNPATWITDGENALLFVKTIRQVALILNKHQIPAPDVVVQVNRGTQCIENQLRCVNKAKSELLAQIISKQADDTMGPPTAIRNEIILQKLQPVNLGPAYMKGVLFVQIIQDELDSLSIWDMGASLAYFSWDRINAFSNSVTALLPKRGFHTA